MHLKVFDNIIVTDPQWSEAWNKRATVYFLMNEFKNSLDDIDKVLSPWNLDILGLCQGKQEFL